ncbi:MAG: hypothetical protein A2289_18265 [Deltaproteobacteria bacterium RIFOXYA12_FULL_58_15]|nr:MAG: hypothetical protein A2289_18265 [Deltaproteobacteria bacterium RIFOXYA12_FULL_58_15]
MFFVLIGDEQWLDLVRGPEALAFVLIGDNQRLDLVVARRCLGGFAQLRRGCGGADGTKEAVTTHGGMAS